jgi:putative oxidoreductase
MNAVARIEDWADNHHPVWLDYLRIILGLLIIVRCFSFAANQAVVTNFLLSHRLEYLTFMGAQYLILIGIGGGILIAFGVLTRFAALINLPIVIGTLFFVHVRGGLTFLNSDVFISLAVLILLLMYLVFGSGIISLDSYFTTHNDVNF